MTGSVAAVDLGATSGRVIVGHVGPDTLEATAVARFANDPVQTSDGLHWNILGLYGAAVNGLREAFRAEPAEPQLGGGCHAEAVFDLRYRPGARGVLPEK